MFIECYTVYELCLRNVFNKTSALREMEKHLWGLTKITYVCVCLNTIIFQEYNLFIHGLLRSYNIQLSKSHL